MEKVLIVLYAYKPFENANTTVVQPFIQELSKHYDLDIVTLNFDNSASAFSTENNIRIFRYKKASKVKEILLQMYYSDPKKDRSGLKKFLVPIGNLVSRFLYFLGLLRHNEYKLLKKIVCSTQYDFVFSTCESFVSCLNVLSLKKRQLITCPWITYFMDPFARFIENIDSKKYRKQEHEIYKYSDLVLATEEICEQNREDDFSVYLTKTKPVKFCNFIIKSQLNHSSNGLISNEIHCVYAGSLISNKIRDPEYFFEIIKHLSTRYVFHLVLYRLPRERAEKYKKDFSGYSNIVWYDTLSFSETQAVVSKANILINLGNKVINQTPSKIFEYMAMGKPIVNIYNLENDTSKKYLSNYPLCLNIFEDQSKLIENSVLFDKFCTENKEKMVSPSVLKERFKEFEQSVVVQNMLTNIQEIL